MTTGPGESGWLLLAATSRGATEGLAEDLGLKDPAILDRYDLTHPRRFLAACRSPGVRHVAVHSVDWEREVMPQLYTTALAAARGRTRWIIDARAGTLRRLSPARNAIDVALGPPEVLAGLGTGLAHAGRFLAGPRQRLSRDVSPGAEGRGPNRLLAIWSGDVGVSVGGAVTHISGVLNGFRRAGFGVGLVTTAPPPDQIVEAVDDFAVAHPPPQGARATPELAGLAIDEGVVEAARLLAERMGPPGIVYQRNAAFRMAGVRLASAWDVPLVLEWNGSETWTFENWSHAGKVLKRPTGRLMAAIERRVARSATLIAAVSDLAAEMALEEGVDPARVITVPNGVDVAEVDAAVADAPDDPDDPKEPGAPLVGWIGSFGDWHGAEVLIRAIPELPPEAEVLMIGDGRGLAGCRDLAAELGVADRVTWAGRTAHDRALRLLKGCDLLASPHVELAGGEPFFGSPTKLFEYMALEKPIVASRLGQIGEVLEDGRTALLVTPGDERELAGAISTLLADPERGREMAAAARREIESAHTWDHRADAVLAGIGRR